MIQTEHMTSYISKKKSAILDLKIFQKCQKISKFDLKNSITSQIRFELCNQKAGDSPNHRYLLGKF